MPDPHPPFAGYAPRFKMPIVAPPPPTYQGTALDYYQQLQIDVAVVSSDPSHQSVDIAVARSAGAISSTSVDATLFAMTGGFVRCYPSNSTVPSPDNFLSATDHVIVLTVWIDDVVAQGDAFPPDVPVIGRVYYIGVDPSQTATILRNETARMSDIALRASWKTQLNTAPPAGTTQDQLIDQHTGCVMKGLASVFVDAGTPIGKAVQDASAPVETYKVALRMTDTSSPTRYVSPLPTFVGAPYYDL